jgi:isopenicillin N synthase-like dioxygenase
VLTGCPLDIDGAIQSLTRHRAEITGCHDRFMTVSIPLIDLSAARTRSPVAMRNAAAQLGAACVEIGFFVITGHGIAPSLIERMHRVSLQFFELDEAVKQQWRSPVGSLYRGYEAVERDNLRLRENFQAGRFHESDSWMLDGYSAADTGEWEPNRWPVEPGEFADVWQQYFTEVEQLGNLLLELCALALDLPADWFGPMFDRQASGWMANYYNVTGEAAPEGSLRLGAHTDSGSLTILYQDEQAGGLQVRLGDGGWLDVAPVPGTFVVNIGDIMAIFSNGTWADTLHRVVHPATGVAARPRISIPFFQGPNRDTVIEPVPTRVDAQHPARFGPIALSELKRQTYENPTHREAVAQGYSPGVAEWVR